MAKVFERGLLSPQYYVQVTSYTTQLQTQDDSR